MLACTTVRIWLKRKIMYCLKCSYFLKHTWHKLYCTQNTKKLYTKSLQNNKHHAIIKFIYIFLNKKPLQRLTPIFLSSSPTISIADVRVNGVNLIFWFGVWFKAANWNTINKLPKTFYSIIYISYTV